MQWFFRPSRRSRPCRRLGKSLLPSSRGLLSWNRSRMLHRPEGDSCWRWSRIEQALLPLVGFEAEKFAIRHLAGYDVACDYLLTCLETGRRPEATDSAMQEVCPVNDVSNSTPNCKPSTAAHISILRQPSHVMDCRASRKDRRQRAKHQGRLRGRRASLCASLSFS